LQAPRRARPIAGAEELTTAEPAISAGRLYLRVLTAAAIVLALDQASKQWAVERLANDPIHVIDGAFSLDLTYNSGGAFGLLQGLPGLFTIATLGIVAGILIGVRKLRDPRWAVPLGMVLGGGLGNAFDRLFRDSGGGVVDFIDLHVWPVFNVADSAIVLGVGVILVLMIRSSSQESEAAPGGRRTS
jgi:signal peptidase II